MRLDDANKTPLDYKFTHTLAIIYKIKWIINGVKNGKVVSILERRM